MSTIQKCDKIIVMHKGEIKEMGTHQELLEKEGLYYKLYQLQYKEDSVINNKSIGYEKIIVSNK